MGTAEHSICTRGERSRPRRGVPWDAAPASAAQRDPLLVPGPGCAVAPLSAVLAGGRCWLRAAPRLCPFCRLRARRRGQQWGSAGPWWDGGCRRGVARCSVGSMGQAAAAEQCQWLNIAAARYRCPRCPQPGVLPAGTSTSITVPGVRKCWWLPHKAPSPANSSLPLPARLGSGVVWPWGLATPGRSQDSLLEMPQSMVRIQLHSQARAQGCWGSLGGSVPCVPWLSPQPCLSPPCVQEGSQWSRSQALAATGTFQCHTVRRTVINGSAGSCGGLGAAQPLLQVSPFFPVLRPAISHSGHSAGAGGIGEGFIF